MEDFFVISVQSLKVSTQ